MADRHYLRIWLSSLEKFGVSVSDAALLMLVLVLSSKKGFCYASKKSLGKILGVSSVTIHAKINKLRWKGLLESVDPGGGMATSCWKVSEVWQEYVDDLTEQARSNDWESFGDSPL
jgi:hypothetical protein